MKQSKRNADIVKVAFSERLSAAITELDDKFLSATELAREFNRRSKHSTVSQTGATKWLTGESIPQQPNLIVLATWLDVDVNWLRYGDEYQPRSKSARDINRHRKLIDGFSALSDRDKIVVERLVRELGRIKA